MHTAKLAKQCTILREQTYVPLPQAPWLPPAAHFAISAACNTLCNLSMDCATEHSIINRRADATQPNTAQHTTQQDQAHILPNTMSEQHSLHHTKSFDTMYNYFYPGKADSMVRSCMAIAHHLQAATWCVPQGNVNHSLSICLEA
jgi:hypothetical protein